MVPADEREGHYIRQTIYYRESVDYWEAKRILNALFSSRWENLREA